MARVSLASRRDLGRKFLDGDEVQSVLVPEVLYSAQMTLQNLSSHGRFASCWFAGTRTVASG